MQKPVDTNVLDNLTFLKFKNSNYFRDKTEILFSWHGQSCFTEAQKISCGMAIGDGQAPRKYWTKKLPTVP